MSEIHKATIVILTKPNQETPAFAWIKTERWRIQQIAGIRLLRAKMRNESGWSKLEEPVRSPWIWRRISKSDQKLTFWSYRCQRIFIYLTWSKKNLLKLCQKNFKGDKKRVRAVALEPWTEMEAKLFPSKAFFFPLPSHFQTFLERVRIRNPELTTATLVSLQTISLFNFKWAIY